MKHIFVFLTFICLVGCNTFDLDEKWQPLKKMVERPDIISSYSGFSTTVGDKIYRANLDEWLEENPPGSFEFDKLLYHEQVHSKRQFKAGLHEWLARYMLDKDFMWYEEQLGYYVTIKYLNWKGFSWGVENTLIWLSKSLAKYRNAVGQMVSYADALDWTIAVQSGRWKPKEEDLWSLPDFAK